MTFHSGITLSSVPPAQAAQNLVPVAVTAGDTIESLRQWPRVGAWRRIGRGCIRGRQWAEGGGGAGVAGGVLKPSGRI